MHEWLYKKRRLPTFLRRRRGVQDDTQETPTDDGFSFAQVIVTMVIVGILGGAIGFTAFQFIGQSRETVLAANIRTAAEAVQNTLALNPDLKNGVDTTTGGLPPALVGELANAAGFDWITGDASDTNWEFGSDDGAETVRAQMIIKDTTTQAGATDDDAPKVRWLVANGDAVRLQIRNDDGSWACALIVLRPDWTAGDNLEVEGNLRGIWFDAGANIVTDTTSDEVGGRHHCSPTTVTDVNLGDGTTALRAGIAGNVAGKDPVPNSGSAWTIPYTDDPTGALTADPNGANPAIPGRLLERTVPDFAAS